MPTNLHALIDSLTTPIIQIEKNTRILWMNSAAEELSSISRQRAYSQPVSQLFRFDQFDHYLAQTLRDKKIIHLRDKDTLLPNFKCTLLDYHLNPLYKNDQLIGVSLEIVQSANERQRIRDENLAHQQKATHESLKGLAHEIKNPLGGIKGAAQLLQNEVHPELTEYTQIIISETNRLHALVSKMLHPNKIHQTKKINIHKVLEQVRQLITIALDERLIIQRDYDPSIPLLIGDPDKLKQVFFNLMTNAINAMKEQGTITIRTRISRQMMVNQKHYRHVAKIDFIDTGPGIPSPLVDKIFFPMVSGSSNGTGMGLAIVQELLLQHHASIEYRRINNRTHFILLIPIDE